MRSGEFSNFGAIRAALLDGGGEIVRKAAHDIEANAKDFAPVDTGNLKASIAVTETGPLSAVVGTHVEYAPHQEYGTVNQSGTPYMRPAVERVRPKYIEAWRRFLGGLR